MTKPKKPKKNLQMLIHQMDEDLYHGIIALAAQEKRSVGKQAEYMLQKQFNEISKVQQKQ